MDKIVSINCLPDEIIIMVLKFSDINDIVKFSLTCKHFHKLIKSNQIFWKERIKTLHPFIYEAAEKHCKGRWLQELKRFMMHKKSIYEQLLKMSSKHYWKIEDVTLNDIGIFFNIASKRSLSYYYSIHILQDFIIKVNENTSKFYTKKPFTLTELYYAKTVLRHLMHCFLCVKWVKNECEHTLQPENVVNYFLQWMDIQNLHDMENVEKKLQEVADTVKECLLKTFPLQLKSNNSYTTEQILYSVSHILFQENRLSLSSKATFDTLDIMKIWDTQMGNEVVIYAIYQAVARRAGLVLELITFANHLFLEWKCPKNGQDYKINLTTGALELKSHCPYSPRDRNLQYSYSPDSLLRCLHSAYIKYLASSKIWTIENATNLLGFLGGVYCHSSPYDNFYGNLYKNVDLMRLKLDFNLKYLTNEELQTILSLLSFHRMTPKALYTGKNALRVLQVKEHDPKVLYAVGMICCHKLNDYVCVIREWDPSYNKLLRTSVTEEDLLQGYCQAFYKVMAADQSERYIAQENLIPLADPMRLEDIETILGREFSYFDGFCYVLNEEKAREYPEEGPIIEVFRQRFHKSV